MADEHTEQGTDSLREPQEAPEAQSWPEPSPEAVAFYEGALRRIRRLTLVFGLPLALGLYFPWRVWGSVGALLGTALAYFNFTSLARSVQALGERVVKGQSGEHGGIIVVRFLGRICLIALVAYGIFTYSEWGLYALLAGLSLPVAAMLCEAAWELIAAVRRGY